MDNVSAKHPFAGLYQWVDVDKFWAYLYGLCLESVEKDRLAGEEEEKMAEENAK